MTQEQQEQIRELRRKGTGYRNIAAETGIPRDTVRSFCKRNGLDGYASEMGKAGEEGRCRYCGKALEQPPTGRKRKFCSDDCRREWWKRHPEKIERKQESFYPQTCRYCGKEFLAYGNKGRRYCSRGCYIRDRFWREEDGREPYAGPKERVG